jgi:hypothetical protein
MPPWASNNYVRLQGDFNFKLEGDAALRVNA